MNACSPRVVPAATLVRALQLAGPGIPVVMRLRVDCPACRMPLIANLGPGTVAAVMAEHAPHCTARLAALARLGDVAGGDVPPGDRFRGGIDL